MTKLLWLDVKEWSHSTTGTDALDFLHTVLINELVMQKEASRDWYDKVVILTLLLSRGKTDGGLPKYYSNDSLSPFTQGNWKLMKSYMSTEDLHPLICWYIFLSDLTY